MKHLKMIDTQEKEQAYRLSKEYLSPYVGLTTENSKVTYSRPNSYITVTVADGHEMKLTHHQLFEEEAKETTLGGGTHKLDMILDYSTGWEILEGKEYLTAINFDDFTTFGDVLIISNNPSPFAFFSNMCYGCTSLISVQVPKSFGYIPTIMFSGCTSLSSVTIDEGITEIQTDAFNSCTSLSTITLPNSLETLYEAIQYCTSLTSITIPENVISLEDRELWGCSNLRTVTFKSKNNVYSILRYLTDAECPLETLYVQPNLLDAYKNHIDWTEIADKIKPIEE